MKHRACKRGRGARGCACAGDVDVARFTFDFGRAGEDGASLLGDTTTAGRLTLVAVAAVPRAIA
jgi:hypothetical protein